MLKLEKRDRDGGYYTSKRDYMNGLGVKVVHFESLGNIIKFFVINLKYLNISNT